MENKAAIWKSNQQEVLADLLLENIFSDNNPFSQQIVIVPGEKQAAFLKEYTARQKGIYAGFTITPLKNFPRAYFLPSGKIIPTQKDLALAIEAHLDCFADRKRHQYAQDLSKLFVEYSTCTYREIEAWKKKGSEQAVLWKKIFRSDGPYCAIPEALFRKGYGKHKIHVFGFLHLARSYLEAFMELGAYFYMLNPCQEFWEDEIADWTLLGMDERAVNAQPILANWCAAVRKTQSFLDPECDQSEPYFNEPLGVNFLHYIQNDLLTMRALDARIACDRSVQIHACTSYFREVEVTLRLIEDLLGENKQLAPCDILILSPSLERYVPAIQAIFGLQPRLAYQILDVAAEQQKEEFTALFTVFEAIEADYPSETIFQILALDCVKAKWDIAHLQEHFIEISQLDSLSQRSWLSACKRALFGQIFPESYFSQLEHTPLEIGEIESLATLCNFLSFMEEVAYLRQASSTPTVWAEKICSILERLCELSESSKNMLSTMGQSFAPIEAEFSFQQMLPHVKSFLSPGSISHGSSEKNALTFSPLKEGSIHPAKVIILLGLDEESFPGEQAHKAFSEIAIIKKETYVPSRGEKARLLFLEALLAAREFFHTIYCHVHPEDQKTMKPSLIVHEWMTDLALEEIKHPTSRLDPFYFSASSPFLSYDPLDLATMQGPTACLQPALLRAWQQMPVIEDKLYNGTLQELSTVLKNAPYFYFKNKQGVQFKFPEQEDSHAEFFLSAAKKRIVEKQLCEQGYQALEKAIKAGLFPNPPFLQGAIETTTARYLQELKALKFYKKTTSFGEIELCSDEGVFVLEPYSWKIFLQSVAIMAALAKDQDRLPIIFLSDKKIITPEQYPENLLADLARFFSAASQQAIPWHYKFAEGYFKQEAEFMKLMQTFCATSLTQEGFSRWLTMNPECKDPARIYKIWAPFFQEKLGRIYELYAQL